MDAGQFSKILLSALDDVQPARPMAYVSAIKKSKLDYSADSLARLDHLLDSLKAKTSPAYSEFTQSQAKLNFVFFVAFYIGETIARLSGQAARWHTPRSAAKHGITLTMSLTERFAADYDGLLLKPVGQVLNKLFRMPTQSCADFTGEFLKQLKLHELDKPVRPQDIWQDKAEPEAQSNSPNAPSSDSTALGAATYADEPEDEATFYKLSHAPSHAHEPPSLGGLSSQTVQPLRPQQQAKDAPNQATDQPPSPTSNRPFDIIEPQALRQNAANLQNTTSLATEAPDALTSESAPETSLETTPKTSPEAMPQASLEAMPPETLPQETPPPETLKVIGSHASAEKAHALRERLDAASLEHKAPTKGKSGEELTQSYAQKLGVNYNSNIITKFKPPIMPSALLSAPFVLLVAFAIKRMVFDVGLTVGYGVFLGLCVLALVAIWANYMLSHIGIYDTKVSKYSLLGSRDTHFDKRTRFYHIQSDGKFLGTPQHVLIKTNADIIRLKAQNQAGLEDALLETEERLLLPMLLERIQAGETVSFELVELNADSISYGARSEAVANIGDFAMDGNDFGLFTTSDTLFARLDMKSVPNVHTLVNLIERIKAG